MIYVYTNVCEHGNINSTKIPSPLHITLTHITLTHITLAHLTSIHVTSTHLTLTHITLAHIICTHITSTQSLYPHITLSTHHSIHTSLYPHITLSTHHSIHITLSTQRILSVDYMFPEDLRPSESCLDLLSRMLVADPSLRATIEEVMAHPWYLIQLPPGVLDMNKTLKPPVCTQVGCGCMWCVDICGGWISVVCM